MNAFSDLALRMDPALIIEQAGMMPDPWQRDVLRQHPKQLLLNCSRQAGKSTTVGAMALDEAVFAPDPGLVLILSPSLRQSREAFRVIMHMLRNLAMDIEPEAESSLSAEFASGSRIVALPGKEESIRGFSKVKLLIVDEAARVADDLYRSVRPMLAVSGGRIAVLSTPFGKRGFFFKEWTDGENWNRVRITARTMSADSARVPGPGAQLVAAVLVSPRVLLRVRRSGRLEPSVMTTSCALCPTMSGRSSPRRKRRVER